MYISKSLCQLAIAAFLGSSLFIKGLAMPVDVTEVSMNNSLEPRGFLRGAFAGALGAHLANKFRDKKKEDKAEKEEDKVEKKDDKVEKKDEKVEKSDEKVAKKDEKVE